MSLVLMDLKKDILTWRYCQFANPLPQIAVFACILFTALSTLYTTRYSNAMICIWCPNLQIQIKRLEIFSSTQNSSILKTIQLKTLYILRIVPTLKKFRFRKQLELSTIPILAFFKVWLDSFLPHHNLRSLLGAALCPSIFAPQSLLPSLDQVITSPSAFA